MKKIVLMVMLMISSMFGNELVLSGEYAKDLGNPFRVLLEKKDKNISIYSIDKDVVLKVESNLDNDSVFRTHLQHPKTFVLKNKSVENIVKQYYGEEYNVILGNSSANVIVNVLSGKVILDYMDVENQHHLLKKVEVELTVEIIENGVKRTETVLMDDKLNKTGKDYTGAITTEDISNISIKTVEKTIKNIIEFSLYTKVKG